MTKMKITKRQLRRIIKEEKAKLMKEMVPGRNLADDSAYESDYNAAYNDLFEAIESALARARREGVEIEDVQTIINDAIDAAGY